jgi:hypothetical protein
VRYRSQDVEVGGVVYQMRAQVKQDGRVQVTVRGGGEATGELVAPADHLAAPGRAVVEVARAFGERSRTHGRYALQTRILAGAVFRVPTPSAGHAPDGLDHQGRRRLPPRP